MKTGNKPKKPFTLCAPFPGMDIPWTEEKKEELRRVLDKIREKDLEEQGKPVD
jgi:hypothetical protein